ncbi:MAG: Ig-like domain-containing protein, partial [Muribaculaceae bacterium]|nr:Ig-like domain-containing protein [Muribaculaceae bacterium]
MQGRHFFSGMRLLAWIILAVMMAACASMGRPGGGARDEEPPYLVNSDPRPGAVSVMPKRLTAVFNENIQLEDAF